MGRILILEPSKKIKVWPGGPQPSPMRTKQPLPRPKRASAEVLGAHATEPKTVPVVWIHFDSDDATIVRRAFLCSRHFATMLEEADTSEYLPVHKRRAGISSDARPRASEQQLLLRDGIWHKAVDEVETEAPAQTYDTGTVVVASQGSL